MERWYRQDLERWPETHGHAPVTDRDFWFTTDGTTPTGRGVPFEHAEWELAAHVWASTVGGLTRQSVGGALFVAGVATIMPGLSYAHVPWTGPAGIAFNIVAGGAMMLGGAYLMGTLPPVTDVHWDRATMPYLGASPVVWGVPGYVEV